MIRAYYRFILGNLGLMSLFAGIAMATASHALPGPVPRGELEGLSAGTFNGGLQFATNPQSNSTNACHYCTPVPVPANGAVGCFDVAQYLVSGNYSYTQTTGVPCNPENRYGTTACTKPLAGSGTPNCGTTKTVYTDP